MTDHIEQQIINISQQVDQYYQAGRYQEAIALATQALELARRHLNEDHPTTALALNNLGLLYTDYGDFKQAEPLLQEALRIYRTVLGDKHPNTATSLHNLALAYKGKGDFGRAESLLQEALVICQNALGKEHPDTAISLRVLGMLYQDIGDFQRAEPLYREALAIFRKTFGDHHPQIAKSLVDLGMLYLQKLSFNDAEPCLQEALVIARARLGNSHPGTAASINCLAQLYHAKGNLNYSIGDLSQAASLYEEALAIQRSVLGYRHFRTAVTLDNLAALLGDMGNPGRAEPLSQESLAIFRRLLGDCHPDTAISLINLAGSLAANRRFSDAFVQIQQAVTIYDHLTYQIFSFASERQRATYLQNLGGAYDMYLSLVAQHLASSPGAIRAALDLVLRRKALGAEALAAQRDAVLGGRYLHLQPQLQALTTLRMQIAQKTLAGPGNADPQNYRRQLAEWTAQRERMEADLARQIPEMNLSQRLAAAPDFDLGGGPGQPQPAAGRRSRDLDRAHLHFTPLPGTHAEGEHLARMLQVQPWLAGAALEAKLKAQRSPRILHLATHGFFLEDQPYDPEKTRWLSFTGGEMSRLAGPGLENPLLRSGLALAGVNTWLSGKTPPPEAEDGLLTAEDVTGLDLLDTDLVVLSACETGLGDVQIGEGVLGLRRSFVLAGAKTLVMSLWKVPDQQTQELMEDFYTRLLQGQPRADALRAAQLTMKTRHPEPHYWGAFICQGELGPLHQP